MKKKSVEERRREIEVMQRKVAEKKTKPNKQKAYKKKISKWKNYNEKVSKVSGLKFLDKSDDTIVHEKYTSTEATYSKKSNTDKIWPTTRRQDITERIPILDIEAQDNVIENVVKPLHNEGNRKKTPSSNNPFTRELCEKLRVPCRFVTEHPCCKLPQDIEMLGRPRGMDGSADLRWRNMQQRTRPFVSSSVVAQESDGGPRQGPQGRMISGLFEQSFARQPSSFSVKSTGSNRIPYNHAWSKDVVSVPRYHYNGGPGLTSTILRQCWRLTYLTCSNRKEMSHPCCALTSASKFPQIPGGMTVNPLDKWLSRH